MAEDRECVIEEDVDWYVGPEGIPGCLLSAELVVCSVCVGPRWWRQVSGVVSQQLSQSSLLSPLSSLVITNQVYIIPGLGPVLSNFYSSHEMDLVAKHSQSEWV